MIRQILFAMGRWKVETVLNVLGMAFVLAAWVYYTIY